MTAFTDIRAALESEIASISGVPDDRAWENVRFEPTTGSNWLRMSLFPTMTRAAVAGSNPQLRYQGIFTAKFSPGDIFTSGSTNVRISYSERQSGRSDGGWYFVPVTVGWFSYRQ